MEHFGKLLKKARESRGLSQRELASLVNFPQGHISKIERGMVDLRLSSFLELARILGMEPLLVPHSQRLFVEALLNDKFEEEKQIPLYQPDEE